MLLISYRLEFSSMTGSKIWNFAIQNNSFLKHISA